MAPPRRHAMPGAATLRTLGGDVVGETMNPESWKRFRDARRGEARRGDVKCSSRTRTAHAWKPKPAT
ncbi:hypothetical protein E4U53_001740 [Claviceps sorghi]|nr:hypothetical protein E4U53_001740 [Claviceps sorghi]